MANKHLRREPIHLSMYDVWYYEEPSGLVLCVDFGPAVGAKTFTISWRRLRGMIARKDRPARDGGEG